MIKNIESRVSALEQGLLDQHMYYSVLINLIIRNDDHLRLKAAEAIRLMLQKPVPELAIPVSVQQLLRSLRYELLSDPNPEVVEIMNRSSVHLVKPE